MLPCAFVLLFGAIAACASGSAIARHDVHDDDRKIFERATAADRKSMINRLEPFYYVSYDLYENLCTNERCNDVAELFLTSVRKSTKPCDDFYAYACAKRQNKARSSPFKEIQEILEQRPTEKETKALTLEKKFYRSCMEQRESGHKTKREFTKLMELSNGLSLFQAGREFGVIDWSSIDGFYASLGFGHAFFDVHVVRDPERSDVNLISLTAHSPLHHFSVQDLLKYKGFAAIFSNLLGNYDRADPYVVDYEDVIDLDNALYGILPAIGTFEENTTTLTKNKMTLAEWQKMYDSTLKNENEYQSNHINWLKLINTLLKSVKFSVNKSDKVVMQKLEYFTQLSDLLQNTSPVTIEKYIHFKFLTQIDKYFNTKSDEAGDRSTFCIKQFNNQLVGATHEYIKRHVPREQKVYAEKVMNDVREALVKLLSSAEWMDRETKSYASGKLKNLNVMLGYPDWQANRAFVSNYYGNLRLHSNFFENVLKFRRRSLILELRGLKNPHLYDPLTMSKKPIPLIYHFEVNSHTNQIFFPAEYLNEKKYKLFSPDLPSSINYGSLGSMLGSILYDYVSLTDNFNYNEFYTRTTDGLSENTIKAYKIKEKCLTHQLSHYEKTGSKFDQHRASVIGLDTIQVDKVYEKISGLRAAFEAYKKEVERSSGEALLPGFENMNKDQLFFLAYAERICEIGDVYDKYDAYETSLKVNGVVSNLEVFSSAFQCSKHSEMNRETKCELFA